MQSVGTQSARTHFSSLLARVAHGERITITRRGTPIAVLSPADVRPDRKSVEKAIKGILELRKGQKLRGLSIREMVEEGRR